MGKRARVDYTIGVLSSHPLVVRDVSLALPDGRFQLRAQQIDGSPGRDVEVTVKAPLYIVDGQLPRAVEEGVVGSILRRDRKSRIVVIAESFAEADAFRRLNLGVKGLVRYRELDSSLTEALETVAGGGLWVRRALLSRFLDAMLARSSPRIASTKTAVSIREREVLAFVLDGASNKQIAARLNISERTVKFHVSNLLSKFDVQTRQQLIRQCLSFASEPP